MPNIHSKRTVSTTKRGELEVLRGVGTHGHTYKDTGIIQCSMKANPGVIIVHTGLHIIIMRLIY